MKKIVALLAFVLALASGVPGCGGVSTVAMPPGTDAAPGVDVDRDAAAPVDASTVPDAAVDVPPAEDRLPPSDAATEICHPREVPSRELCTGAPVCQPNLTNPTCVGALSCVCNLQTEDMPATLCTPDLMASCMRATVSCTPGHNRCSLHLPADVEYVGFSQLEARDGHGGLRQTVTMDWHSLDRSVQDRLLDRGLRDGRGFVQVCFSLPVHSAIPAQMQDQVACATCSDDTCYWNRGEMRAMAPSLEFRFSRDGCRYERRLFARGATDPVQIIEMTSDSTTCS